jgi:hypothetical protein
MDVSSDAITRDRKAIKSGSDRLLTDDDSKEPINQRLVYATRISRANSNAR